MWDDDICRRCRLRASNERRVEAYDDTDNSTVHRAGSGNGNGNGKVCTACLGVLQDETLKAITSSVLHQVERITHSNLFRINATFPPALSIIRDRAFALAVYTRRYGFLRQLPVSSLSTAVTASAAAEFCRGVEPPSKPLVHLSTDKDSPASSKIVTLRDGFKWTLSSRISRLSSLRYSADSELFIEVMFAHDTISNELGCFPIRTPAEKKARFSTSHRSSHSSSTISRLIESLSDFEFNEMAPHLIPPPSVSCPVKVSSSISVANAFISGSYNKWSRVMSQTPWLVNDPDNDDIDDVDYTNGDVHDDNHGRQRRTATSVEDVVLGGVRSLVKSDKLTFIGGGREDVDVRMLGTGRPFIVEIVNPNIVPSLITPQHLSEMTAASINISNAVSVNGLRVVDRAFCSRIKAAESEKRKFYRCVIWTSRPISSDMLYSTFNDTPNGSNGFQLDQKTPLRVLHRRTQLNRPRSIFRTTVARIISEQFFVLDVEAQAGTYIKEFVHGDNGRTNPSVATLLDCHADILQLDVLRVRA